MTATVVDLVRAGVRRDGARVALRQGERTRTYDELWAAAGQVAAAVVAHAPGRDVAPFVAIVGTRSLATYEHLLGVLVSGRGYLPLEPEQPARRLAALLDQAGVGTLVTEAASLPWVAEICAHAVAPLLVVVPDATAQDVVGAVPSPHRVLGTAGEGAPRPDAATPAAGAGDPAYLLFTSGSTGLPKGVVVEHRNVVALLEALRAQVATGPADVVAQLFKLSFDPSVMMVLLAWTSGAELVVPEADAGAIDEASLITRHGVTIWGSVPSRSTLMRRLRQLKPDAYPTVRVVIQGGEALTADVCEAWALAAPHAQVLNHYGPTETTVAVVGYRWDPRTSPEECEDGRVPIGEPFAGVEVVIVDADLAPVPDGATGELLVGGAQVARGYLHDPERTAAAFVRLDGRDGLYYRTGDLVRRAHPGAPLSFAGRADHQVKVLGRRIELGEVEAVVRAALGVAQVAALGWPRTAVGYDGIEVFVVADGPFDGVRDVLVDRLPPEAVPRRLHALTELPLTDNGKVDRRALEALLRDGAR